MKNHIIFKFIAVLLCAASLMGAVGGILGVALLTSGGLYDVSVEEMVGAQISQDSADLADWLAKNYASTELGGASEALVQSCYGDHWFTTKYDSNHYGYTISDGEGNELISFHPELREREDLYVKERFPITGTYLHVVNVESREQEHQRLEAQRTELLGSNVALDENTEIPAEGIVVDSILFAGADGQPILEAWDNGSHIMVVCYEKEFANDWTIDTGSLGFLFYSPQGNLVFHSAFDYQTYVGSLEEHEVYEAYFTFQSGAVRLRQKEMIGQVYLNPNGHLMFLSQPMAPVPAAEETVPDSTELTVPETTAETSPPDTVPPEESWVENQEETDSSEEWVNSDASAVPEEGSGEEGSGEAVSYEETEAYVEPTEETYIAETVPVETLPPETVPEETIPEIITIQGKPLDEYQINTQTYYDHQQNDVMTAEFVYVSLPQGSVEIYMTAAALRYQNGYKALALLRQFRNYLLPAIAACLLIFAIFGVYLCTAAGRKPKCEEVRAGGLNRLPLDLYLLGGGFAAACVVVVGQELFLQVLDQDFWNACAMLAVIGGIGSLIVVAFCFAFVAQIKTPDGFWWRNTLCGRCIHLFVQFILWLRDWLTDKAFPFCGKSMHTLWQYTMVTFVWMYKRLEKAMRWLGNKLKQLVGLLWWMLHRFLKLLPVTWQWLLAGVVMIFFTILAFQTYNEFAIFCFLMVPVVIILYIAHCYGTLAESTRRMSKGDLATQVDDSLMVGCFKDCAADLNALADVANLAAQNQLKSERMKTELITNVSHDIKTPLTSIISYVDLLRKPHSDADGAQYLEVLDRQSQQLKKLIDDLMDMSKAHTGNMQVDITEVDAVEAVTQALGEFSDKLNRAGLIPVFRHSDEQLMMQADGRLLWRVLSNLLSNTVKYALPGTRLYVDLMELEGTVVISLKNISREELRFTSEELMARFVRGDASRNSDGSGLGLNIARSLMELQKGQLQLMVDGDLFKVTLIFPSAEK